MEIVLFAILVGVWAAFVVPSVVKSRREKPVVARQPRSGGLPQGNSALQAVDAREKVLARRRMALIALVIAPIVTLVLAIMTGSWPILAASLVFDVLLAGYVAILLQIKQRKAAVGSPPVSGRGGDVRVYGG